MGDVIGVLLGAMRPDQLDSAEGLLELLDCRELHLLVGNPIEAQTQVVRYSFPSNNRRTQHTPAPASSRTKSSTASQEDVLQCLVVAHSSAFEAYIGIIRKCNVLIGTPAGVAAARLYNPLATYWTVPA